MELSRLRRMRRPALGLGGDGRSESWSMKLLRCFTAASRKSSSSALVGWGGMGWSYSWGAEIMRKQAGVLLGTSLWLPDDDYWIRRRRGHVRAVGST